MPWGRRPRPTKGSSGHYHRLDPNTPSPHVTPAGSLKKHTGRELPIDACPIRFGSWMGGDRDGNPNVTAKVSW